MANFFSASQEEQQEILLSIWQRFKYAIIGFFVLLTFFIVARDYINESREQRDLETSILFQEYLESDEDMPLSGQQLLDLYPDTLYSDFVRLNQAKKDFKDVVFLSYEQTKDKDIAKLLDIDYWTTIVVYKNNKEVSRSIGQTNKAKIYFQITEN